MQNFVFFIFLQQTTLNQDKWLFASDKINTVMTVILIIWIGIALHLLWLNRKVSHIEDKINKKEK